MRRAGKTDANHQQICDALKTMYVGYLDLARLGHGVPDLLVYCGSAYHLWEIKNPKTGYGRKGLNKHQRAFAERWRGGPITVIRTVDEAIDFVEKHGGSHGDSRTPKVIVTTADEALRAVGLPINA